MKTRCSWCWAASVKYSPSSSASPPGPANFTVGLIRTRLPPRVTVMCRSRASRPSRATCASTCTASSSQSCRDSTVRPAPSAIRYSTLPATVAVPTWSITTTASAPSATSITRWPYCTPPSPRTVTNVGSAGTVLHGTHQRVGAADVAVLHPGRRLHVDDHLAVNRDRVDQPAEPVQRGEPPLLLAAGGCAEGVRVAGVHPLGELLLGRYVRPVGVWALDSHGQPTAPSICSSISRFSSRAYSIGSSRAIGSTNPRTTMAAASSSVRPRLIR